jgi:hypothetical protein
MSRRLYLGSLAKPFGFDAWLKMKAIAIVFIVTLLPLPGGPTSNSTALS